MDLSRLRMEDLTPRNLDAARAIRRDDISEEWVDHVDVIMEYTQYGLDHGCKGHTWVVILDDVCVGVILLGEAIPWDTDPEEMRGVPFYRLMGFVIDQRYRGHGIGSCVLNRAVDEIYREFGVRPIALGVHRDNHEAARFYVRHGFVKTGAMEGNDCYYIRYSLDA